MALRQLKRIDLPEEEKEIGEEEDEIKKISMLEKIVTFKTYTITFSIIID
jgi:hypothetical protein